MAENLIKVCHSMGVSMSAKRSRFLEGSLLEGGLGNLGEILDVYREPSMTWSYILIKY